jgi:hypothetical protein
VIAKTKKMKRIQLTGLLIFILSVTLCAQTAPEKGCSKAAEVWKSVNENSYSIQYPENWELNTSGQMGMSFILLSKQLSAEDLFRENINLIIQDLEGQNIDLDKYVELSEGQIKTLITNSNLMESKRQNENGSEFQKVIYTGDQGSYHLKFEQNYWIKNGKAYVLTFTGEIDQFDRYKEVGEKIMKSFRLK